MSVPIAVLVANQLKFFDIQRAVPERTDHFGRRAAQEDDVPPGTRLQRHDEPSEAGSAAPPLIPKR
jgi:hypothetical protein